MDTGSVQSLNNLYDTPLPTPPAEKNAITTKRLSYVFGFLYSLFLIIFALTVYIYSITNIPLKDVWSPLITIYIISSGLIILVVLIVDVKLFTRRIRKQVEVLRQKEEELELEHLRQLEAHSESDGTVFVERNYEEYNATTDSTGLPDKQKMEPIDHNYCFAQGRHAGSVYLKFGAAAFALGHFVHTILLVVVVHVSILLNNAECINVPQYIADVLECLYCFVQLYFIFNYSNLIIIKHATLARLAFLHIMAGNLCLWVYVVSTETVLAYRAYEWVQHEKNISTINFTEVCQLNTVVVKIFDDYSAYLYPFTVEFNILTVGIFFMVWRNIGKCRHSTEEVREFQHSLYAHSNVSGDVNSPHVLDIHISCRNAMGGLFSSLFAVVILIVCIIVGFVLGSMSSDHLQHLGYIISDSIRLLFHITMLIATVVVFRKTSTLDINKHPMPWLDDVLLYICVPAFFLETLLTVVAVVNILNVVKLLDTIIMSLQMILQIAFIIDGLRRCSNSRKLRRTKPGRELVLFLLVCNVCMWIMYTFSYKSPESKDERYKFYGKKLWLAIGHLCAPLIMFFRFHSSVCIADIWSYAYKPGIEDH